MRRRPITKSYSAERQCSYKTGQSAKYCETAEFIRTKMQA